MSLRRSLFVFAVAFAIPSAASRAQSPTRLAVGVEDQEEVAVTAYNNGYGLVREVRKISLPEGTVELEYRDVAELIDATSVAFKALDAPDSVAILEQNYRYDLMTPSALLDKFVGRDLEFIRVRRRADGSDAEYRHEGTLLSNREGVVVRFGDRIEINPEGAIRLPSVPPDLLSRPTLLWLLSSASAGERRIETSYLTEGMSWKADYVATVDATDAKLDVTGWVTLENRTGATFRDAKLKLVAGDVRRVQGAATPKMDHMRAMAAEAAAPGFEEKAFFDYHLYTLGRPTTLANNETKQTTLLEGAGIPAKRNYVFRGAPVVYRPGTGWKDERKASIVLEFENREEAGLGMPLPAGRVRVYKADDDGSLQLVGEDSIGHTPRNEKVSLTLGEAFDIVATFRQTDLKKISNNETEQTFQIEIRNRKTEAIETTVLETLAGDWTVTNASAPHRKRDATTLEFVVALEPDATSTVEYTVRTKW